MSNCVSIRFTLFKRFARMQDVSVCASVCECGRFTSAYIRYYKRLYKV